MNKNLISQTYKYVSISFLFAALGSVVGSLFLLPLFLKMGIIIPLVSFVIEIGLIFYMSRALKQGKSNSYLSKILYLFGFVTGLSISPIISLTLNIAPFILFEAIGITALIVGLLSIFAKKTSIDFRPFSQFLFIALISLILFSLVGLFFHNSLYEIIINVVALILFSIYLIVDTQRLVKEENNPVIIALSLYIDIFNIFISVLDLLLNFGRD